jgi:hypothetical protein
MFFQFAIRSRIRRALGARTQVKAGAGSAHPGGSEKREALLAAASNGSHSAFEGRNGSARNSREGARVVRPRAANHSLTKQISRNSD